MNLMKLEVLFGLAGLPSLPLPLFSYAFSKLGFETKVFRLVLGYKKHFELGNYRHITDMNHCRFFLSRKKRP